ncbi:MAG TPA: glycosyltransferase family 4 protein [Anaerolineaceae bacterium]|nr:glycosyltransferase family 4 protein [Anaerolineaceae bacterium]
MKTIYIAGNFLSKSVGVRGAGEDLAEKLRMNGWKVITASTHPNRVRRLIDLLWTAWHHRNNYQVVAVEVYSDLAFRWAELLCTFLRSIKKSYILTLHGGKLPEFAQKNSGRFRKLLLSAKAVTTPSKYLQQELLGIHEKIIYLPNGIELSVYPSCRLDALEPNLIWLRAFHQIYNPELAIEVLNQVVGEYPDTTLTMIGPDKGDGSLSEVRQLIEKYNLTKSVSIMGAIPKDQVGQYLSKGNVFLNTTNYESFGVSVMEAAACGLCIVTTNAGELPFLWENKFDALIVPMNDSKAMADAVIRILTEPGLAQKLSTNARKKAENYDWSVILPQWEALFEKVLNHG